MDKKKAKSSRRSSSSSSSSSNSSDSSREKKKLRKLKKKLKKERKRTEKILKRRLKEEKRKKRRKTTSVSDRDDRSKDVIEETPADIPIALMERSKAMAPMTKEEWDKRQSIIRKVLDEESGRYRLIKGDGEVLEEIVSRNQHKQINKHATRADGEFFQSQTTNKRQ